MEKEEGKSRKDEQEAGKQRISRSIKRIRRKHEKNENNDTKKKETLKHSIEITKNE